MGSGRGMIKPLAELKKQAEAQGWEVVQQHNGHWRWVPPDDAPDRTFVISSSTPSSNDVRNHISLLRRRGFVVNETSKSRRLAARASAPECAESETEEMARNNGMARLDAATPLSMLAEVLDQQRTPVVLPQSISPETLKNWMHEFVDANWKLFTDKWNKEFDRLGEEQDGILAQIKADASTRVAGFLAQMGPALEEAQAAPAKAEQAWRTAERVSDELASMRSDVDVTMRSAATLEDLIGELADNMRQIRELYAVDVPRLKSDVRKLSDDFTKFTSDELPKLIERTVKTALEAEVKRMNVASEVKKLSDELGKTLDAMREEMLGEISKRVNSAQEAVAAAAISPLEALRNRIAGKG